MFRVAKGTRVVLMRHAESDWSQPLYKESDQLADAFVKINGMIAEGSRKSEDVLRYINRVVDDPDFIRVLDAVVSRSNDVPCAIVSAGPTNIDRLVDTALDQISTLVEPEYFTPVSDADVPKRYAATLTKYRKLATEHDVPTTSAVCYRVRAGFALKTHASQAGPCQEDFQNLQNWKFTDEPTKDCLAFWVPRILNGSTSKTVNQQTELLANLQAELDLSAHHMNGFGQVGLVAGLILAHFRATGERTPLNRHLVRTDTRSADSYRLNLGRFDGTGLCCSFWDSDGDALGNVGVFALGVEPL